MDEWIDGCHASFSRCLFSSFSFPLAHSTPTPFSTHIRLPGFRIQAQASIGVQHTLLPRSALDCLSPPPFVLPGNKRQITSCKLQAASSPSCMLPASANQGLSVYTQFCASSLFFNPSSLGPHIPFLLPCPPSFLLQYVRTSVLFFLSSTVRRPKSHRSKEE